MYEFRELSWLDCDPLWPHQIKKGQIVANVQSLSVQLELQQTIMHVGAALFHCRVRESEVSPNVGV